MGLCGVSVGWVGGWGRGRRAVVVQAGVRQVRRAGHDKVLVDGNLPSRDRLRSDLPGSRAYPRFHVVTTHY